VQVSNALRLLDCTPKPSSCSHPALDRLYDAAKAAAAHAQAALHARLRGDNASIINGKPFSEGGFRINTQ
jgi:hypothetical protein